MSSTAKALSNILTRSTRTRTRPMSVVQHADGLNDHAVLRHEDFEKQAAV